MVLNSDTKQFFYCGFDLLNTRIAKFNYFTGVGNDQVVVLFGCMGFFKLRDILLPFSTSLSEA